MLPGFPERGGADANEAKPDAAAVDDWRQRLQWSMHVTRALGTRGQDRLTSVGEIVQIPFTHDPVRRLRASRVLVKIGDLVAHESLVADAPEVFHFTPTVAGLFRIETIWLDEAGQVVPSFLATPPAYLQVVDQMTIGVDGALLFDAMSPASKLWALAHRGCSIFYFDTSGQDRSFELRAAIEQRKVPSGAILSHAERGLDVRTLGVDFRAVFLTVTLRRLRGAGIPLVGLVSSSPEARLAAERAPAGLLDPAAEAGSWWNEAWEEQARTLARPSEGISLSLRLDRMTATRAEQGNQCTVELDNGHARRRLFELIESAVQSVHLQFYLVRAGSFSDRLGAHLVRAARRGVRVRLLVDALYSLDGVAGATNAVLRGLASEPGIDVVSSAPIVSRADIDPLALKRRDHRKVVIVDEQTALVGGRNCADEYWTGFEEVAITDWTPHDRIPWFDAHAEVRGPVVEAVAQAFRTAWSAAGGAAFEGEAPGVALHGSVSARLVLHDGVVDAAPMLAYEALIAGARSHIYIVNDFPIVQSLRLALKRALARGVRIRILTGSAVARRGDGTLFEGPLHRQAFEYMTKQRIETLLEAGVEVYELRTSAHPLIVCRGGTVRPYVHAKIVSVDASVASVGSANLDATASYWEREANLVIEDDTVVAELEAELSRLCEAGGRIDPSSEDWRKDRLLRELAAQLWPESLYG